MPIDTPFAAARNESFWQIELAAGIAIEVEREDRAGIGRRERDARFAAAGVREDRREQALAGEHALAGADEQIHEAAALLPRAVAEDRRHLDRRILVHEAAGLGHRALAGVELDLDVLHLAAVNLVIDLVGGRHRGLLVFESGRNTSGDRRGPSRASLLGGAALLRARFLTAPMPARLLHARRNTPTRDRARAARTASPTTARSPRR